MKKLMVALAGLAMCFAVNAATYNWSGVATAIMTPTYSPIAGTFYAFDATQYSIAAIESALTTTGAGALDNSLNNVAVASGIFSGALSGTANTTSGISADTSNNLNLYGILVDSEGKNFAVVNTASPVLLNESIQGGSPAGFNFNMVTIADNQWQTIAVPEPTSGLLLLLGMAGLALKRKRA